MQRVQLHNVGLHAWGHMQEPEHRAPAHCLGPCGLDPLERKIGRLPGANSRPRPLRARPAGEKDWPATRRQLANCVLHAAVACRPHPTDILRSTDTSNIDVEMLMFREQKKSLGIGVAIAFVILASCCLFSIAGMGLMWFFVEDDRSDFDTEEQPVAVEDSEETPDDRDSDEDLQFTSLGLGVTFGCAIDTNHQLHCWGLDQGRHFDEKPQGRFIDVDVGNRHNCAIDTDHQLQCWGQDQHGQVEDTPSGEFQKVVTKQDGTCAMTVAGELKCWGAWNRRRAFLEVPDGQFKTFDVAAHMGCAIDNRDRIQCWGDDRYGLTDGAPSGQFRDISVGGRHACALDQDSEVVCWGDDETQSHQGRLIEDAPSGQFAQIETYSLSSCVRDEEGGVQCWGDKIKFDFDDIPQQKFETIEIGAGYACGLDASQAIICWASEERHYMMDSP